MDVNRKQLWQIGLATVLVTVLGAGWFAMRSSAQRLEAALSQEQDCRSLVGEIQQLKNRPGFAALTVDSPRNITTRAEDAAFEAGLEADALVRIEPQSAMRLGDAPYRLRPTRLELRGVSMQQVIKFAHHLIDESQGTTLRDLRLTLASVSSAEKVASQWNAEIVLTQLIFAPASR